MLFAAQLVLTNAYPMLVCPPAPLPFSCTQIRACDDKTRAWYEGEEARGAAYDAAPQPPNVEEPAEAEDASAVPIPPHNGFGDEDDSLRNCMAIDVRAPRPDLSKFLAFDGTVYRLYARLDGAASGLAAERRFTLALYPADDTLQILEAGVSAGSNGRRRSGNVPRARIGWCETGRLGSPAIHFGCFLRLTTANILITGERLSAQFAANP
jgi:hypothetical protein